MKKWIAVLLSVLCLCLAACGGSSDKKENDEDATKTNQDLILGTWEAEVDMTEMMQEIFAADEDMGEFIHVSDFKMKFLFTFEDTSMMKLEVDEDVLSESFDTFFVGMKDSMYKYFESALAGSDLDMTVEEFLEKSQIDLDALVEDMSGAALETMKFDEMSYDCYYEVRYNKLYSYAEAGERDEEEYIKIEFPNKNTLKFVEVKTEDTDNILNMITELKRVSE